MRSFSPDDSFRSRTKFIVSACLAGIPCRYDGRSNTNDILIRLAKSGQAVLVCPEILGGLSVPRLPCEIRQGRVYDSHGLDKTVYFIRGARIAMSIALMHGCTTAILKARSPSCGHGRIYDGSFRHALISGNGLFASLLEKNGLEIFTEESISFLLDKL